MTEAKLIPLEDITVLPEIQIRISIDKDRVKQYAAEMHNGAEFDPIDVFVDTEGRKILSDGYHRFLAHHQLGKKKIRVIEHEDYPDTAVSRAIEFSIRNNCGHGLAMSNEDKRKAVWVALSDKILRRVNDKRLAQMCRVSPALVAKMRKDDTYNPNKPVPKKKAKRKKEKTEPRTPAHTDQHDPSEERMEQLRNWIESGKIDWPMVAQLFKNKFATPILWPAKMDHIILVVGRKKKRVPITGSPVIVRVSEGNYYAQFEVAQMPTVVSEEPTITQDIRTAPATPLGSE